MATIHTTKNFTVDTATMTMSCDMSIIRRFDRLYPRFYPESCGDGVILESHITGKVSSWYVAQEHRNHDNDITHWDLLPTVETLRTMPQLREWQVVIFND